MAPASGWPIALAFATKFVSSWAVIRPSWLVSMSGKSWCFSR